MKRLSGHTVWATILLLSAAVQSGLAAERPIEASQRLTPRPVEQSNFNAPVPDDCPLEKSAELAGVRFTGRQRAHTRADTWYPSWAADGNLYSPFTDGSVDAVSSHSGPGRWTTGNAKIVGADPMDLKVIPLNLHHAPATPYGGRYPCGSLVHDGNWYYGTYCLDHKKDPWDIMGPFVGFRISKDLGKTWTDTPCTPAKPLFGESGKDGAKVKMGSPHVVDFGRNMQHSPDGKMYLVGHGAVRPDAVCSWISGDQIYMARVTPTVNAVNDVTKYEFFAGHDDSGEPVWAADFAKIKPLVDWPDRCGCVTITYNAALKKYLMCVTDGGATGRGTYDTWIAESDRITGPWRMVAFMENFGDQAYFVNVPTKFIGNGGRRMWLSFSHGWAKKDNPNPPGSRYAFCLHEFELFDSAQDAADFAPEPNALKSASNIAPRAKATASSHFPQCPPKGAINGVVGGLPGPFADEWSAEGEHAGAWLRLAWDGAQRIDRVWLFDRPSDKVQVVEAELRLSDGTTIAIGELPDDATQGRELSFSARTVDWLEVKITRTKSDHPFIGLSEIAVFRATE